MTPTLWTLTLRLREAASLPQGLTLSAQRGWDLDPGGLALEPTGSTTSTWLHVLPLLIKTDRWLPIAGG